MRRVVANVAFLAMFLSFGFFLSLLFSRTTDPYPLAGSIVLELALMIVWVVASVPRKANKPKCGPNCEDSEHRKP
jgi:hypothetical protein